MVMVWPTVFVTSIGRYIYSRAEHLVEVYIKLSLRVLFRLAHVLQIVVIIDLSIESKSDSLEASSCCFLRSEMWMRLMLSWLTSCPQLGLRLLPLITVTGVKVVSPPHS